jgi:transglutaminase-like putative cysteine protease
MTRPIGRMLFATLCLFALAATAHAQWTAPTPEELSMTAQPEVPGASAVYLYREEDTEDDLHDFSIYARIKILNEGGKDFGTVELPYNSGGHAHIDITDIEGRTIHADGTIIPFTGKPFTKLIEKTSTTKVMSKVFSLPSVDVGSIVEYRYKVRYEDNYYIPPDWYIQSKLFTRKAHYQWKPTARELNFEDIGPVHSIAWFPILPKGAEVKLTSLPGGLKKTFALDISDVPPTPTEEYLPPMGSLSYRVFFYYNAYPTGDEFWAKTSKNWAKRQDKFIGPGSAVKTAVQSLTDPGDAPLVKLHKIYAEVMNLENTDFTREHSAAEDKSNGVHEIRNTDDVLTRKRGSGDQLAELFVAMARAAGFKAYVASITNRDRSLFLKGYLSLNQLDDDIAIVTVDGKDLFFDPGQRFMPFQHLAWKHTFAQGIRQTDKGADFFMAPAESYTATRIQRIAELTLAHDGEASGTIRLIYTGVAALRWRQASLTGDATSLDHDLTETCEHLLSNGAEVRLKSIEKLTDYEEPLTVSFTVKSPIASSAGRRMLIASDLFESDAKPTFSSRERKYAVYFHYPYMVQDVVRIHLPGDLAIESLPKQNQSMFKKFAAYNFRTEQTPTTYTIRRDLLLGEMIYPVEEYPELRTFYTAFEAQDHEPVVLKPIPATAAPAGN